MLYESLSKFIVCIARNNPQGAKLLGTGFVVGEGLIATTMHVTGGDDRNLCILPPKYSFF
ncbi:hypothetical protein ACT7DO_29780 [Bacillus pacificus]